MKNVSNDFHSLKLKTRKKNDYVKLQEGAYPRRFEEQVEKAIAALATDNLRGTKMARHDKRSGVILLTMGFGKRNWWFQNDYIGRGDVAECGTAEEAMSALRTILKAARAGEFNEALEALRIQRQEHAATMIEARDVCGFHRLEAPEEVKLITGPMHPFDATPTSL